MPISALLTRIRNFIPRRQDDRHQGIVRRFALRAPPKPMSDHELSRAIADFLKQTPTLDSDDSFSRRLDPPPRK